MKAEELMIDDWVDFYHPYETEKKIVTRHRVTENFECGLVGISNHPNPVHADHIEPIKITPEILEKNGFAIKKKWAQMGNFGDSPLIMWHFEDNPIMKDIKHELEIHQNDTGKVHVRIPCEFVHELQHAFRLCRINKDIVL